MRTSTSMPMTLALLLLAAPLAFANCESDDPGGTKVAAARAQVAQDCPCDQSDPPAVNHGAYVKCAVGIAQARSTLDPSDANFLPKTCKGAVKKCAARSVCGKPGFVTCCITTDTGTKCKTKKDAMHCTDADGTVSGTASSGCSSCCDACVNAPAPGSGPSCSPSGAFLE